MSRRFLTFTFLLACLLAPSLTFAESRTDVYNGATCIPYPVTDTTVGVAYSYWLYGFRGSAYCHFPIPENWNVSNLSYVLFTGQVSSGTMRARLCLYATGGAAVCGSEATITSSFGVNWVAPPASPPLYASGAYLLVTFPSGAVTTFQQFIPVFWR